MVKNSPSSKKLIILDLQKYCMEIAVNSPPVSPHHYHLRYHDKFVKTAEFTVVRYY